MRHKLDQWRALTGSERRRLIALAVMLPVMGCTLRIVGVRRAYRLLGGSRAIAVRSGDIDEVSHATAKRLARLVNIAARHGPYGATCLRQSLTLWWLLRRRGLPAELRIGAAKEAARMRAHAWVELGGRVINDRPSITKEYAAFKDLDRRLPDC